MNKVMEDLTNLSPDKVPPTFAVPMMMAYHNERRMRPYPRNSRKTIEKEINPSNINASNVDMRAIDNQTPAMPYIKTASEVNNQEKRTTKINENMPMLNDELPNDELKSPSLEQTSNQKPDEMRIVCGNNIFRINVQNVSRPTPSQFTRAVQTENIGYFITEDEYNILQFCKNNARNIEQLMEFAAMKEPENNNNNDFPNIEARKEETLSQVANDLPVKEIKTPDIAETKEVGVDTPLVIDERNSVLDKVMACSKLNKIMLIKQAAHRKVLGEKIQTPEKLTKANQTNVNMVAENKPEHSLAIASNRQINKTQYQNIPNQIPKERVQENYTMRAAPQNNMYYNMYLARRQTMPAKVPTGRQRPPIPITPSDWQNTSTADHESNWGRHDYPGYSRGSHEHYPYMQQRAQYRQQMPQNGPYYMGYVPTECNVENHNNMMPEWQWDGRHM